MVIVVKGTAELPQIFLILMIIFLTIGVVFTEIGFLLNFLTVPIWIIILILLCDLVVVAFYIINRKRLLQIVKEREKPDNGKKIPEVTKKSLWSNPGMIYLIRMGWIPIGTVVFYFWWFFIDSRDRLTPMLIAFVLFVIYAVVVVKYLEKKK